MVDLSIFMQRTSVVRNDPQINVHHKNTRKCLKNNPKYSNINDHGYE